MAAALAFLLGLCVGSFANVFVARHPKGLSLWWPSSRCPRCKSPIRWRHNLPLLGWLLLRGRCADCGKPIPASYPLAELAFGLLGLVTVLAHGGQPLVWCFLVLFWVLLLAAWADWLTMYLYDALTLPLLGFGLSMSLLFPEQFPSRFASLGAALAMALTMLGLQALGRFLAGRDALGGGDVKLMAGVAAFLGWPQAWVALLLGILLGPPSMLWFHRLRGSSWRAAAPFGPALCLGSFLAGWDLLGHGTLLRQLGAWMALP